MNPANDNHIIQEQAQQILASGILGRSKPILRLFQYIVDKSVAGDTPKEIEIAIDVFNKDASFEVGQDSTVRVYIHKLRNRIDEYYAQPEQSGGVRIEIPKGQYRLSVSTLPTIVNDEVTPTKNHAIHRWVLALLAVSLVANIAWWLLPAANQPERSNSSRQAATHPLWATLLDDDLPVTLVLGDYYIFAEMDNYGGVSRLVREFNINSPNDLQTLLQQKPELASHYKDLNLNYLPTASSFALNDVLPVLHAKDKQVNVMMMSEFSAVDLRSSHIIYIGYISAIDKLYDFVFAASGLGITGTFDGLTDIESGKTYHSEAGVLTKQQTYRDYGFFSTFPGPNDNQIMIISGMRDEGLMHTAHAITTPSYLHTLDKTTPHTPAFEALYEVIGLDRTNLSATLVYSAKLDDQAIWGNTLPQ